MNKLKRSVILVLTSIVASMALASSGKPEISVIADKKTHVATVELDSNPTTGFTWFVKYYPEELVDHVGYQYLAPKKSALGKGGKAVFTFTLGNDAFAVPRIVPVMFVQARPWVAATSHKETTVWIVTS